MSGHPPYTRFLVHLSSSGGKTWPAVFGRCLLDQLWETRASVPSAASCEKQHAEHDYALEKNGSSSPPQKMKRLKTEQELESDNNLENCSLTRSCHGNRCHNTRLRCHVMFSLKDNCLVLSEVPEPSTNSFLLEHPEFCPPRQQALKKMDVKLKEPTSHTLSSNMSSRESSSLSSKLSINCHDKDMSSEIISPVSTKETDKMSGSQGTPSTGVTGFSSSKELDTSEYSSNKNTTALPNNNIFTTKDTVTSVKNSSSNNYTEPWHSLTASVPSSVAASSAENAMTSVNANPRASASALATPVPPAGVALGVSVLVESADGHVLMTRRAQHMRTFPGVWVPPGGHVECGESLQAAVLRELQEETGLAPQPGHQQPQVLGLWESVFPPVLGYGAPQRQHLVAYMHLLLHLPAADVKLKLEAGEVDASVWLPPAVAVMIVQGVPQLDTVPATLPAMLLAEDGGTVVGEVETEPLRRRLTKLGAADKSRVSTGTRFALALWLREKNKLSQPQSHL